jgi:hypothetical protein
MELKYNVLALDRHKNVTCLKRSLGFQPSSSDNWISNENTNKNNKKKDMHRFASIQKDCTLPQKQMTSTTAGSVNAHT